MRWRSRGVNGLTLIELMVTLAVFAVLALLAAPHLALWLRNTHVRSAAEQLASALRLAQNEATVRSRVVVFALSHEPSAERVEAQPGGSNWTVLSLPLMDGEDQARLLHGGRLSSGAGTVQITGPAAVCFNGQGRPITLREDVTRVGVGCGADIPRRQQMFDVALPGADRRLRVVVATGGRVRMCDPALVQSDATPQGCPQS